MTDNPTLQSEKLEPCPFCGGAAEIVGDPYEGFTARCVSETCKVSPETNSDWHERKRCADDWNSRAPVVAPEGDGFKLRKDEVGELINHNLKRLAGASCDEGARTYRKRVTELRAIYED